MTDSQKRSDPHARQPSQPEPATHDRRVVLTTGTTFIMAGGLAAGYGTFFSMAGRYLFPPVVPPVWLFVAPLRDIPPGGSIAITSPEGLTATITRDASDTVDEPALENFRALSSVCPHLGCRVHWEPQNNRYFCPCHNGVFDPQGNPVSGPPAAENQPLSQYPLRIAEDSLYIAMPPPPFGGQA